MWLYARLVFTNHLLPGPLFCMCWYSGFVDMPRGIRTLIVGRTKMKSCCRCLGRMKKPSLRFQPKSRLFLEKDQGRFWYQNINLYQNLCLMLIIYRFVVFLTPHQYGFAMSLFVPFSSFSHHLYHRQETCYVMVMVPNCSAQKMEK